MSTKKIAVRIRVGMRGFPSNDRFVWRVINEDEYSDYKKAREENITYENLGSSYRDAILHCTAHDIDDLMRKDITTIKGLTLMNVRDIINAYESNNQQSITK